MEELYEIVKGLNNLLENKRSEISDLGKPVNSYLNSELQNREHDIQAFAESISQVRVSPAEMSLVIANFKRDAETIKERIALIGQEK